MVPDKLGRIIIPPALREYAGLKNEVVVAGLQSRIELWSKEAWEDDEAQADAETTTTAAAFALLADQSGSLGI